MSVMPLNYVAYGCQKKNGKPWNPSGGNVYICGDHFNRYVFKSILFLKWKFLDFCESSCKLKDFIIINIEFFS